MPANFGAQQLVVNDFTGGMTDFFLDGNQAEYQRAENFLLTPDKKLATRPGSSIFNSLVFMVPSGNVRIGAQFVYEDDNVMFVQAGKNIFIPGTTSWQTLQNPNPALAFNEASNYISYAFWNHHTYVVSDSYTKPIKMFKTGSQYIVRTAGLPKPTAPTATGTAGANNYLYAVTFSVDYTINAADPILFENESTPIELEAFLVNAPDISPINLTNLPSVVNGSQDNYDTANIMVRIYRTENNQSTFFFVAEVANGTTSYSDTTPDSTIATSTQLYTTGGVSNNDSPPPAKFVHVLNGYAYYGNVLEAGEVIPNRIKQSQNSAPDSVPSGNFTDLPQEITGISDFSGNLIVFTAFKVYRGTGVFDELGNGGLFFDTISETIGALNHNSIVQTKDGVFFAGIDGFYWTDGFTVSPVSQKLINTYQTATTTAIQRGRIYGTYEKKQNRVYWALMQSPGSVDNDIVYVLDLRFGVRPNSSFTTMTGSASFSPTAICFFNYNLQRADRRGYIFQHAATSLTDPHIDVTLPPSQWKVDPIIYDYRSCSMNHGFPTARKLAPILVPSLRDVTNVSLQIYSHNDNSNDFRPLVEVKDTSQPVWGDSTIIWNSTVCTWNFFPLIEVKKYFPKNKLRYSYKQIRFTNSLTIISQSDSLGLATVDNVGKTATLANVAMTWPAHAEDYFLSFQNDNYTTQYLVTARTNSMLTFSDIGNLSPTGNQKWLLKGYAKNEGLSILAYMIYFTPISVSYKPFTAGSLGTNK